MMRHLFKVLLIAAAPLALAVLNGCSLPKLKIPFTGNSEPAVNDPLVPFNANDKLCYGHTLHFAVYKGLLSPDRIFRGHGMVDKDGVLHIKGLSDIKAGGFTALEVVKKIESRFRAKTGDGIINVQLEKIEDTPLVTIIGSVNKPAVVQWSSTMNVNNALSSVGGRDAKSSGLAAYITRRGVRKLYAHLASGQDIRLQPGDIVTYSSDL